MTKYLIVGDCHGNIAFASYMVRNAKALGISKILQVGDFGIWPGKSGQYYLDTLSNNSCASRDGAAVTWYFVDGNHEDHDQLARLAALPGKTQEGFVTVRSNIYHIPRATRWEWDGVSFLGLGGAYSIDKAYRRVGISWWPGEAITIEDLVRVEDAGQADVLLTHDCSDNAPFPNRLIPILESKIQRQMVDQAISYVKPKVHFHGHYHMKIDWTNLVGEERDWPIDTYGLDCDGMPDSWGVFDSKELTFKWQNGGDLPEPE